MPQIAGITVSVLVDEPLELGGVCVPGTNVFRLEMLQLTVNVVSVAHSAIWIEFVSIEPDST